MVNGQEKEITWPKLTANCISELAWVMEKTEKESKLSQSPNWIFLFIKEEADILALVCINKETIPAAAV